VSAGTNPDPGDLADIPEEEKLAALKYLIDEDFVEVVEREDGLFPGLNAADWASLPAVAGPAG
jgi:hypothetical protein